MNYDAIREFLDPQTFTGAFLLGFLANIATAIALLLLFHRKIVG
jgi:hypothetical protein